ncbi:MAG: coproporphyrinogen dehydrogenase HemZ [Lentisphaeria bacterium]|nr:coproporphyrinogen dehydrogenase HemZ [Lentisphaeria bacterium]
MKLYLTGHDYRYAVEQMVMTLFPGERPVYPSGRPEGDRMEVRLSEGEKRVTATCAFWVDGVCFRGMASVSNEMLTDKVRTASLCQQIVKLAVYRAVLRSGRPKPPWGALSGVRPGKLLTALLQKGLTEEEALRRFRADYDVSAPRAALCLDAARETRRAISSLEPNDVCLYVGIPFCPTRCAYCSFVSQAVEKNRTLMEPFLSALLQELKATAEQVKACGLRVVSVYMGGGTPTTLSAAQLDELCTALRQEFDLSHLREFTVEAGRPDTIDEEKLRVLRRHGVSRVSVNPQTMTDDVLEAIGRKHTAADIVEALRHVRAVGGFQVNMDLIAGLPTDDEDGFCRTIDRVLALEPENITVHTLSIKRGARLHFGEESLPSDEAVASMLDTANTRLRAAGYRPYYLYRQKNMAGGFENTGWVKGDSVNLYNICIMEELCSVLAMGAGGSTKLIRGNGGRNERMVAPKYPQEYIEAIGRLCADKEKITRFYAGSEE